MALDITIRELSALDLSQGFLDTLAALADVSLSLETARDVFRNRLRAGVRTFVAILDERVVGTTSLLLEQKFIHGGSHCGHIEDVVVHADCKHHGVGSALVRHATAEAKRLGCYKVILSCYENLVPYYERLGYRRHDVGMRIDLT